MSLLTNRGLLGASIVCAGLAACAGGSEPGAPTVVRTRAPQGYEKTITDYFAFRLRGPQKNTKVSFGAPEPGSCALDGYLNSARGWVVPVFRETFTGEPTGRETILITAKQYYFWFFGDTIAGITPRADLCPGIGSAFDDVVAPRRAPPGPLPNFAAPAPARPEALQQDRAKSDGVQAVKKKRGNASAKVRDVRKKNAGDRRRSSPATPGKPQAPPKLPE